jgi:type IV secretion system protein VirB6
MVDLISGLFGNSGIAMLAAPNPLDNATKFIFFTTINNFLRNEIDIMQWKLLSSSSAIIGVVSVVVLTVWIMFQGFRIVTGQSRQPMMVLVGDALKATLVVFIATTAAYASSSVYWSLSDGMSTVIAEYVTGESGSPFQHIDNNLAGMELAMGTIDAIDTGGNSEAEASKERDRWFTGIGIAGPSVIAGSMLLLNKIALALFVGFGPIFIMCLLFEPTKQLFNKWLLYGIGTVFSLAVLSVMVTICMKMMAAITAAFAVKYLISMPELGLTSAQTTDGINSMALQQGGLGLLLTTMILSAPPMAAAFFQGTLGQFNSYSPFGRIKQDAPNQQAGMPGMYSPTPPANISSSAQTPNQHQANQGGSFNNNTQMTMAGSNYAPARDEIRRDGQQS